MADSDKSEKRSVSIKLAPGAVVCEGCELKGDITIGARTVVHPKARIIAEAGPIIIGESNLIEEQSLIINRIPEGSNPNQTVMIIGNNNAFEVNCRSEALKIGDNNTLEGKAHLGRETELTNGCVIGAGCVLTSREVLPENTVIYGGNCARRVQSERPPLQTLQLDFLAKILPNYHHIYKTARPQMINK